MRNSIGTAGGVFLDTHQATVYYEILSQQFVKVQTPRNYQLWPETALKYI